jgi:hypothetical protein
MKRIKVLAAGVYLGASLGASAASIGWSNLTTSLPFEQWTEVMGSEWLCQSMIATKYAKTFGTGM